MIFELLFHSGAAPQRLVARHSGEDGAVLLVLQWFASHFWHFGVLLWWPRPSVLMVTQGTGVTRGGQQPGGSFGRKKRH